MSEKIIGAAIEDSHISVGLVDFETRKVVRHSVQRLKVDPFSTADQIIAVWVKALKQVAQTNELENVLIGISIPGVCNYETGVLTSINGNRYRSLYAYTVAI
jgi:predicted NBD/HSP70 family sugar kinase